MFDEFFRYYEAGNWYDKKGEPVLNWKQKLLTWDGRRERKAAHTRQQKKELKSYRARIREEYGDYLSQKNTRALIDIKNDGGHLYSLAGFLIDEILEQRNKL